MKTRNGFVSNSSSSSFIVAFKKKPENVSEVKELLFGTSETLNHYGDLFPTWEVAQQVFNDIKEPLTEEEITEEFSTGYCSGDGGPDRDDFKNSDNHTDWKKYGVAVRKYAEKEAKKFISKNKNAKIYKFNYSDNDSQFFAAMEHEGIFDNLPHKRISHH